VGEEGREERGCAHLVLGVHCDEVLHGDVTDSDAIIGPLAEELDLQVRGESAGEEEGSAQGVVEGKEREQEGLGALEEGWRRLDAREQR